MASKSNWNYSLLIGTEYDLNLKELQRQLENASKKLKINLNTKSTVDGLDAVKKSAKDAADAGEDLTLSYQSAQFAFDAVTTAIKAMTQEVIKMDGVMTELRKVTDLSGDALTQYQQQLADMGSTVARTGW